jgi:C_GCAxxG_C_C family probable redox protein
MDDMFRMMELAQQGFCCSQVLLIMGLEAQGKSNPDLVRAVHGLCGGLGSSGDICGTLTGGACLLSLYAGRGSPEEEKDACLSQMVAELVQWFVDRYGQLYGGINCRDILADDPDNYSARCPGIVAETYQKVKELLTANGFDLSGGRT